MSAQDSPNPQQRTAALRAPLRLLLSLVTTTALRTSIMPSVNHYACMIDLLGRAGYLEDALKCLREMPYEPTKAMLGSLQAAGKTHRDLELSEFAATKLVELEPGNSAYHVFLSNLYAEMGRWNDVEKVRAMTKQRDLRKDLRCSLVELEPFKQVDQLVAQ